MYPNLSDVLKSQQMKSKEKYFGNQDEMKIKIEFILSTI